MMMGSQIIVLVSKGGGRRLCRTCCRLLRILPKSRLLHPARSSPQSSRLGAESTAFAAARKDVDSLNVRNRDKPVPRRWCVTSASGDYDSVEDFLFRQSVVPQNSERTTELKGNSKIYDSFKQARLTRFFYICKWQVWLVHFATFRQVKVKMCLLCYVYVMLLCSVTCTILRDNDL